MDTPEMQALIKNIIAVYRATKPVVNDLTKERMNGEIVAALVNSPSLRAYVDSLLGLLLSLDGWGMILDSITEDEGQS